MNTDTISTSIIAVDYSKSLQSMMVTAATTGSTLPSRQGGFQSLPSASSNSRQRSSTSTAIFPPRMQLRPSRPTTGEISGAGED